MELFEEIAQFRQGYTNIEINNSLTPKSFHIEFGVENIFFK